MVEGCVGRRLTRSGRWQREDSFGTLERGGRADRLVVVCLSMGTV